MGESGGLNLLHGRIRWSQPSTRENQVVSTFYMGESGGLNLLHGRIRWSQQHNNQIKWRQNLMLKHEKQSKQVVALGFGNREYLQNIRLRLTLELQIFRKFCS